MIESVLGKGPNCWYGKRKLLQNCPSLNMSKLLNVASIVILLDHKSRDDNYLHHVNMDITFKIVDAHLCNWWITSYRTEVIITVRTFDCYMFCIKCSMDSSILFVYRRLMFLLIGFITLFFALFVFFQPVKPIHCLNNCLSFTFFTLDRFVILPLCKCIFIG